MNAARDEILAICPPNLGTMLADRVAKGPERTAFLVPDRAPKGPNHWRTVTWDAFQTEAHEYAAGLLALGVRPEERVAIAASTRYEWIVADFAVACAGGATTTIYPNTTDHDVLHILADSGSVVLVAENQAQVAKVQLHDDELGDQVRAIVIIEDDRTAADRVDQRVISWGELREQGRAKLAAEPGCVQDAIDATGPDTLSTLIYTSGTTGRPKGVELTQQSWTFIGESMKSLKIIDGPEDIQYLWLPLSHVFGKCLLSVQLAYGFATAVDGRVDRIVAGLQETRPTFMCGAPRIFEKVRNSVMTASPSSGVKGRIARWAFAVGKESRPYRLAGEPMPPLLARKYALADKLVFSKLKDTMGGNLRFLISGSAKLSGQVQEWFYSAGITVFEGYGSTETSAIAFVDHPAHQRFGTVGQVTPGLDVEIADDGEILLKGPTIFRGYHNMPEETAEALQDGWFHTGDTGELDADGYLSITDRKKDLIKTSGGKYVAPQKVEAAIAANIPYASQAVVLGEGRKYIVALVTLDRDQLLKWAKKRGKQGLTYEELTQLPEINASIERFMAKANERLERWETVKRFAILDHEFSVNDGGVTPNMKVRRNVVAKKYAHVVESLYEAEG